MSTVTRIPEFNVPNLNYKKYLGPVIVFLVAIWVIKSSLTFVPPGYVGAVYDRGTGVQNRVLREGLNVLIPWWQSAKLFDARLQEYTMAMSKNEGAVIGDDSLDAPTSDGQQVRVDVTVMFKIDPEKAPLIWKNIGPDYVDKVVRPIARSQIRMIVSRYSAPQIYSEKRQEAEETMQKEIAELFKSKYLYMDKVLLRAVYFSPEYSQAIEDKVIAEQRIKQAEYEASESAQRAQSKIAEAKGLAEAQALQKASLTQEYLQLEAIKKWDGHLPTTNAGTSLPFLNLR